MHFHLLLLEGQQVFQLHELQLVRLFTVLHLDLSQLQHLLVVSFQPSEPVSHQLVVLRLSVVQTHLLVYLQVGVPQLSLQLFDSALSFGLFLLVCDYHLFLTLNLVILLLELFLQRVLTRNTFLLLLHPLDQGALVLLDQRDLGLQV